MKTGHPHIDPEGDIPPEILEKVLLEVSRKAINEAKALGFPIMVEEEGKLIRIFPDGSKVEVKDDLTSGADLDHEGS